MDAIAPHSEKIWKSNPAVTPLKAVCMMAPATCGELIQGYIDGQDFLVNCPIDLYAQATVTPMGYPRRTLDIPQGFSKIRDVAALAEQEFYLELRHQITIDSVIPRGKGMASSTADITAALAALCRSGDLPLSDATFARLITEIEPSDCVHFPGIAHVNHLTGELFESLPTPVGMSVLVFDCGGEIDTISFDRQRARQIYRDNAAEIRNALNCLRTGLRSGNLQYVADGATRSAQLSQHIHRKPQFDDLLKVSREAGALGVNCAHSGSVLGVLYQSSSMMQENLLFRIAAELGSSVELIGNFHIIGGGYRERD